MSAGEVCVVDDDLGILKAVGRLLSSANWSAKTFSDPQEFLDYSKMHRPPLAVVDIRMPLMGGLEVQSRLSAISPATRVIICTGRESYGDRVSAFRAGAVAFFNKPFDSDVFLAAVYRVLKPLES